MHRQVETTTKILDIISAVAKNTRVLGFNAGIEAAVPVNMAVDLA